MAAMHEAPKASAYVDVARRGVARLLDRLGRRQRAPAGEDPPEMGAAPALALSELAEEVADGLVTNEPTEDLPPPDIRIRYDTAGEQSERDITLEKVWRESGKVYFRGICHLRRVARAFRADGTLQLTDLTTGQIAHNPQTWLLSHPLFAAGPNESPARPLSEAVEDIDRSAVMPTVIHILYETAAGDDSERAVTLQSVWREGGKVYFRGFCHLRGELRSFRADRVIELTCLATGEVPDEPLAWLQAHALFDPARQGDPTAAAIRKCRDELSVLAYLAHADGALDPDEVEVAIDLVMMATEAEIDRDRVAAHVRRLTPAASATDIEAAVTRIAGRPERLAAFRRAKRRLVDADGLLHVSEQLAAAEIAAFIEARLDRETDREIREFAVYALGADAPGLSPEELGALYDQARRIVTGEGE
jgi:hypothetical protein